MSTVSCQITPPDTHLHWYGHQLLKSSVVAYYPTLWPLICATIEISFAHKAQLPVTDPELVVIFFKTAQESRNQVSSPRVKFQAQGSSFKFQAQESGFKLKNQVSSFKLKNQFKLKDQVSSSKFTS